jgi:hypothetical protein
VNIVLASVPIPGSPVVDEDHRPGRHVNETQLKTRNPHEPREPVRLDDLELSMRFTLEERGDSVRARVSAEAMNTSTHSVDVCGCFSFWRIANVPGTIVGTTECDGATLQCQPVRLGRGDVMERHFDFSFVPGSTDDWYPDLAWVECQFYRGRPGDAWHDAESIALQPLEVPLGPARR